MEATTSSFSSSFIPLFIYSPKSVEHLIRCRPNTMSQRFISEQVIPFTSMKLHSGVKMRWVTEGPEGESWVDERSNLKCCIKTRDLYLISSGGTDFLLLGVI